MSEVLQRASVNMHATTQIMKKSLIENFIFCTVLCSVCTTYTKLAVPKFLSIPKCKVNPNMKLPVSYIPVY